MSLLITTPPVSEPVTLAEVKSRLRLASTADDAMLTSHITAAREFAEKISNRSLAAKSYAYILDRFPAPGQPIRVPMPPLVSVTAVKWLDSDLTQQTWDASEYFVANMQSPALIVPKPGFVYPSAAKVPGAVEVDFVAGAGIINDWKRSIQDVVVFMYENPGAAIPVELVQIPKIYLF